MNKIALLSCDSLEGFVCYDDLLIEPFAAAGYKAEMISWKSEIDWNEYEAVIVRSTWDYQDEPERFMKVLEAIHRSSAILLNPLNLMKWNLNKRYLLELQSKGVYIIPSEFSDDYNHGLLLSLFEGYKCDEVVIKPCVSANSDDTFKLSKSELSVKEDDLRSLFANRSQMYQPFIPSVVERGEYSLFYFAGSFSHAILKTPKAGDFRVQEEHGGSLARIEPDGDMKAVADFIASVFEPVPLYARIDLVSFENKWALMEVELIEPSLYFNLDSSSATRFVEAYKNIQSQKN
ncbi:MAG: hypothetical protein NE327_06200 [Lentisphaeraceae bacterium]|nr:hypothetical protein [Lentisphaeraceae bacterium]